MALHPVLAFVSAVFSMWCASFGGSLSDFRWVFSWFPCAMAAMAGAEAGIPYLSFWRHGVLCTSFLRPRDEECDATTL